MCGICGIFDKNSRLISCINMNKVQAHRGPDDEGYVFIHSGTGQALSAAGIDTVSDLDLIPYDSVAIENYDLVLGSRRLAILDLSSAGHMPMSDISGRCWVVHNGEIYNYKEIRSELINLGYSFRSDSDTEVILTAYLEWGVECLSHFNGMFAFALWDSSKKRLFCARDRFGIKPFYYYWDGSSLIFASEIKAILQNRWVPRIPNDQTIFDYLILGLSDHSEFTFFKDIVALPPGHFVILEPSSKNLKLNRWWKAEINPTIENSSSNSNLKVVEQFADLLEDAIRLRLRSDVPVGSALSGGLDSSAIVCLANKLLINEEVIPSSLVGEHQKTFTARYDEDLIDEYKYSNLVIKQTGADEHVVFPKGDRLWSELSSFVWHLDEPVNSTSQYAQWNVMRLARENGVTVLLDGQGGDEILAGYYSYLPAYLSQIQLQKGILPAISAGINVSMVGGSAATNTLIENKIHNLPWFVQKIFNNVKQRWDPPGSGGSGLKEWQIDERFMQTFSDRKWKPFKSVDEQGLVGILYQDLTSTNLPKLLRYEDRNSMAFSLETRLPFLDYRLVEMVFSLPLNFRINKGWTKWILRSSMASVLPKEICWRRTKLGFPTPEINWFRDGIPLLKKLLSSHDSDELLNQYIRKGVLNQICGQQDNDFIQTPGLWRLINLIVWFDLYFKDEVSEFADIQRTF